MALKERTSHMTKTHTNPDGSEVDVPTMTTIGSGVTIGQNPRFNICQPIEIGDNVTIGDDVTLGGDNHIHSGAVLEDGSKVGHGVTIPEKTELKEKITVHGGVNYLLPGEVIKHDVPTLPVR